LSLIIESDCLEINLFKLKNECQRFFDEKFLGVACMGLWLHHIIKIEKHTKKSFIKMHDKTTQFW